MSLLISSAYIVVGLKDAIQVFSRSDDKKHFSYNHDYSEEHCIADKVVDFIQFSPSSNYFAALFSDKTLVVWSIAHGDGKSWNKLGARSVNRRSTSLCFDPDEDFIYIADKSGDVCTFALVDFSQPPKEIVEPILGHVSILLDVAVTKKYIISADRDEKVRVSRRDSPHVIESFCLGHTEFVCKLLPLDDDKLITTSGDGTICMWDMESGKLIQSCDEFRRIDDKNDIDGDETKGSDGNECDRPVPSLLAYAKNTNIVAVACLEASKGSVDVFNIEISGDKPMKKLYTVTLPDGTAVLALAFDASQDKVASLYVLSQCENKAKILCFSCSLSKENAVESDELDFVNALLDDIPAPDISLAFYAQMFKNTVPGHTYEVFYNKKKNLFKKQSNSAKRPKLQQ